MNNKQKKDDSWDSRAVWYDARIGRDERSLGIDALREKLASHARGMIMEMTITIAICFSQEYLCLLGDVCNSQYTRSIKRTCS